MQGANRESDENTRRGAEAAKLLFGRLLGIAGLVLLPVAVFFVSVALDALVVCMGAVGFYLGARTLGIVVIVLAVLAAIAGLLIGQGYIVNLQDLDAAASGLRRGLEGLMGN